MRQLLDALGSAGFIVTPSLEFDLLPHCQVPLGFSSLVLVYFYFMRVYIALGQRQSRAEQLGCALKCSKVTWWGRGWVRARSVLPGASCPEHPAAVPSRVHRRARRMPRHSSLRASASISLDFPPGCVKIHKKLPLGIGRNQEGTGVHQGTWQKGPAHLGGGQK